jgi:HK97 family phage major capsid protein
MMSEFSVRGVRRGSLLSLRESTCLCNYSSDGFRRAISDAILIGDGVGKPQGLLNPIGGIPICDTALSRRAGTFTWQDLIMLKYEISIQWRAGGSYLMNQRTFALLLTMSDANGRPLLNMMPQGMAGYMLAGSPIIIVSQFPDVAPGATAVAFGDWRAAYTLVNRAATTITPDPYSAGWCILWKCEARIGGAPPCPNAARLLRIR